MASIAYVTDKNMIEYHRLNGNQTMNFWRPSSSKRMADFHRGDLLFFLCKGTERKKEKGIVGYGRYKTSNTLSFNKMWNLYGSQNGYEKKEELYDAIAKVVKSNSFPKTLNCLYLTDVVFFQNPIYLSDLGNKISKSIESYIYLDKEDLQLTTKILNKAKDIGVDVWTAALSNKKIDTTAFEYDVCRHVVSQISIKLNEKTITEAELKKQHKLLTKVQTHLKDYYSDEFIHMYKGYELMVMDKKSLCFYIPVVGNQKDMLQRTKCAIGHIILFKSEIIDNLHNYDIQFVLVYDSQMLESVSNILEKINYKYMTI